VVVRHEAPVLAQREVRNTLAPYMGLSLEDLNAGKILIEATKIAARHQIQVPGDWMLVFKAIVTVEGMGRTLDPQFDLLTAGREMIKDLVKNQYSVQRLGRDFLWVAKDVATLLQTLPRQIRWMFRTFNSNDFAFEIKSPDLENVRRQLDVNGRRLSSSVVAAGLFVASSISLQFSGDQSVGNYPLMAVVYFGAGVFILLRAAMRSYKAPKD
jgi:ubiquinone biosynthesis protein